MRVCDNCPGISPLFLPLFSSESVPPSIRVRYSGCLVEAQEPIPAALTYPKARQGSPRVLIPGNTSSPPTRLQVSFPRS